MSTAPTVFGATSCMSVPHLSGFQSHWNLSPQYHRIWRLWKTIRSRDEAFIIGICALTDPNQLPGPLLCEGTRHVSMIGNSSLRSISASPKISLVMSPPVYPVMAAQMEEDSWHPPQHPKRPVQPCKLFANDPHPPGTTRKRGHSLLDSHGLRLC